MEYRIVRGTKDILPGEIGVWQEIEEKTRRIFALYNFREIRTPLLEDIKLFNRSLGEASEVVQKQMFVINRDDDVLVLRPEGTASVARAWVENGFDKEEHFGKFFYIGPMFRAERPQKGRLRQFHHIGCEVIGSVSPSLDIEVISLLRCILSEIGVRDFRIKINSLGCSRDKAGLSEVMRGALRDKKDGLCRDCQARYDRNVLRIMDCKSRQCRQLVDSVKIFENYLCPGCRGHFDKVLSGLGDLGIEYEVSSRLVRGLDYYTGTVFEVSSGLLGAQDVLCGGGRYDNLISEIGGSTRGAVGFAIGVERAIIAMGAKALESSGTPLDVYIIPLSEEALKTGSKILYNLRLKKLASDMDYEVRSLKANMRKANESNAKFVIILGDDELRQNAAALKDMRSGGQEMVPLDNVVGVISERIAISSV